MIISILLQIIISCCFIYVYDKYAYTKTIDCKLKKLHINNFLKIAIMYSYRRRGCSSPIYSKNGRY